MTLTDAEWSQVRDYLLELVQADTDRLHAVNELVHQIEVTNGINTYVVVVRWLDHSHQHPRQVDNPQLWPPAMRGTLTATVPITSDDIRTYVAAQCPDPIAIYVTRDPTGRYGWKKLSDWP